MFYFTKNLFHITLSATAKKLKHNIKVSNKKQPTEQKWRTLDR
jgi:hypothetical protein